MNRRERRARQREAYARALQMERERYKGDPLQELVGVKEAVAGEIIAAQLDGKPRNQQQRILDTAIRAHGVDELRIADPALNVQTGEMMPEVSRLLSERRMVDMDIGELRQKLSENEQKTEDLRALLAWWDALPSAKLSRNEHSRLHKLREAFRAGRCKYASRPDKECDEPLTEAERAAYEGIITHCSHTFVVKHDWAKAFEGAEGLTSDDVVRPPYPACMFEFVVSGRPVIAYAFEGDTSAEFGGRNFGMGFSVFVECGDWWWSFEDLMQDPTGRDLGALIWSEIRAICIALEAEVATHEVVRAPSKLNEKRERQGRPPLADYHIIDLARRHRVATEPGEKTEGARKRLHFRRGHWRHYETHKTWIKWQLVGDPSLGFVGAHYSL